MIRPTQHARRNLAALVGAAALGAGLLFTFGVPTIVSAHHVTSVVVECNSDGGVATVNVASWTGDVILGNGREATPTGSNGHATFAGLANGTYHLYREPNETDLQGGGENLSGDNSGQQTFVVNCEKPCPTQNVDTSIVICPTPTATPTATP